MTLSLSYTITVQMIGALVGALGVCIAVYLQMVSRHRVSPVYSIGFFVFGAVFMLYNVGYFTTALDANELSAIRLAAMVLALKLELGAFYLVMQRTSIRSPREVLDDQTRRRPDQHRE